MALVPTGVITSLPRVIYVNDADHHSLSHKTSTHLIGAFSGPTYAPIHILDCSFLKESPRKIVNMRSEIIPAYSKESMKWVY